MGVCAGFGVRVGGGDQWLRAGSLTLPAKVPRRGFADRLVEYASTFECTQVRHRLGNRGAAHESFDAVP